MDNSIVWFVPILLSVMTAATPLVLAASGQLIAERSGVLNLGVEGMMLMGAIAAFAVALTTDNPTLAILAGAGAGAGMALIFAVITLGLQANQVATGLALSIFGIGLSAMVGANFVGQPYAGLPEIHIPVLAELPVVGPLLFQHDFLVYLSLILPVALWWFITRSRGGLILRAVGDNPHAAHALGYNVIGIRFMAVLFGGAMAGLGGAYLSTAYTPHWAEGITAGRGWIALALVVFATWRPFRVFLGAYLFGGITIAQLHAQSLGVGIDAQILSMAPYVMTIVVLVIISSGLGSKRLDAPASLGRNFHAGS